MHDFLWFVAAWAGFVVILSWLVVVIVDDFAPQMLP
jgi:hypothetical protein